MLNLASPKCIRIIQFLNRVAFLGAPVYIRQRGAITLNNPKNQSDLKKSSNREQYQKKQKKEKRNKFIASLSFSHVAFIFQLPYPSNLLVLRVKRRKREEVLSSFFNHNIFFLKLQQPSLVLKLCLTMMRSPQSLLFPVQTSCPIQDTCILLHLVESFYTFLICCLVTYS